MIRTFSFAVLSGLYVASMLSLAFVPDNIGSVAVKATTGEIALANN